MEYTVNLVCIAVHTRKIKAQSRAEAEQIALERAVDSYEFGRHSESTRILDHYAVSSAGNSIQHKFTIKGGQ